MLFLHRFVLIFPFALRSRSVRYVLSVRRFCSFHCVLSYACVYEGSSCTSFLEEFVVSVYLASICVSPHSFIINFLVSCPSVRVRIHFLSHAALSGLVHSFLVVYASMYMHTPPVSLL